MRIIDWSSYVCSSDLPMQNMCMDATTKTDQRDPSLVYGFDAEQRIAPGTDKVGAVWAVSAETGETEWKHEQRAGAVSMVATGGGPIGRASGRESICEYVYNSVGAEELKKKK